MVKEKKGREAEMGRKKERWTGIDRRGWMRERVLERKGGRDG